MHYQFQQSSPIYCGRCLRYVHRQSVGHCSSWLVVFMLVVVQRQGLGQTVEKTVAPQLHSSDKVVDVPFVLVVQILRCRRGGDSRLPLLPLLRNPLRTPHAFLDKVVDMPVACNNRCFLWLRSAVHRQL